MKFPGSQSVYIYPDKDRSYYCNIYVIRTPKKQVLIDLGKGWSYRKFKKVMRKDGLDIDKTDEIWITHIHPDHAQVAWLAKKLNCPVRCHPEGVKILCSPIPWTSLLEEEKQIATTWQKQIFRAPESIVKIVLRLLFGKWFRAVEKERVKIFEENEVIDFSDCRVRVIFTPGHTKDSVSYLIVEEKILITGDLVRLHNKVGIPCYNTFDADFKGAMRSIRKYYRLTADNKIESIAAGHKEPIVKDWSKILQILLLNLENGRKLKRRAEIFFKDHKTFWLWQLANFIDDLVPEDVPRKEKMFLAFVLAKALNKI